MSYPLLDREELAQYGDVSDSARLAQALYAQQLKNWPELAEGAEGLKGLLTRALQVGGAAVELQHNPARIVSTGARLDPDSIAARPCFLCPDNRPVEQRAVQLKEHLLLLCNPRPVFPSHFTIAHSQHQPQSMEGSIGSFLECVRLLGQEFAVIFNGAEAGASAPDHLHFQAFPAAALPLLRSRLTGGDALCFGAAEATASSFAGAPFLRLTSAVVGDLVLLLNRLLELLSELGRLTLLNLIATLKGGAVEVYLFPRSRHRPACFSHAEDGLLISPAALELGGVVVAPRRADYDTLAAERLRAVLSEVCRSPAELNGLLERLRRDLTC